MEYGGDENYISNTDEESEDDNIETEYDSEDDNIEIEYDFEDEYKEVGDLCKEFIEFIEDWISKYNSVCQIISGDTSTERNTKITAIK